MENKEKINMSKSNKNLNRVLAMKYMRNQSIHYTLTNVNIALDLVNRRIYAYQLTNYAIFSRSNFKHSLRDFQFCESVCIRLSEKPPKEYLKLLESSNLLAV